MSATSLEVIEQTATQAITVTEDTQAHLWHDGASGNDANDGTTKALAKATWDHGVSG